MNSIDEKVRKLEGTSRVTPIDMKSLDDRINNLMNKGYYFETINGFSGTITKTVPEEYKDFGIYVAFTSIYGGAMVNCGGLGSVRRNGETFDVSATMVGGGTAVVRVSKNGTKITFSNTQNIAGSSIHRLDFLLVRN